MSVTEVKEALGQWSLRLRRNTPRELLDIVDKANYFGHVALIPGRGFNVSAAGDGLLTAARYVGVFRARFNQNDEYEIKGVGMAAWLGNEDQAGDVYVNAVNVASATFQNTIRALLPAGGSITEGTLFSVGASGTYTGSFQWQTPREAIARVCNVFTIDTSDPVEWRVNGDGTLDAGKASQLYNTVAPSAMIVRREGGRDLTLTGFQGSLSLDSDVEDYATKIVVFGEGDGAATAIGQATGPATPYKDIKGNPVVMVKILNEPDASAAAVGSVAAVAMSKVVASRSAAQLSTDEYDIKGTLRVGDALYVYDVENGFFDTTREAVWRGETINPILLRCTELTYPVPAGWTVAFRDRNGAWYDLSDYYAPEQSDTTVVVGEFLQRLGGSGRDPVNGRTTPDTSVPGVPGSLAGISASYNAGGSGETRAQIQLSWTIPANTDGTVITDGDHFEVRYRALNQVPVSSSHLAMSAFRHNQMLTHRAPLTTIVPSDWNTLLVGWDATQTTIQELTPGASYDFQIRAVDSANPPNVGAWSSILNLTASMDSQAPDQPAPPVVAGNTINVQVVHYLGSNSGGTFNLAPDLDHLEIHAGGESFMPSDVTIIGRIRANQGMMLAKVPAVGTFPTGVVGPVFIRVIAVDRSGNKSNASDGASATAVLVDDAHISDLTVTKVTAGTISADWITGARIKTADDGARAEMNSTGFHAYNAQNVETFKADNAGDVFMQGTLTSGPAGRRLIVNPAGTPDPQIRFMADTGTDYSYIGGFTFDVDGSGPGQPDSWVFLASSLGANSRRSKLFLQSDLTGALWGSRAYLAGGIVESNGLPKGGVIDLLDASTDAAKYASLNVWNEAGALKSRLWLIGDGRIYVNGTTDYFDTYTDEAMFRAGLFGFNAVTSMGFTYNHTMVDLPYPIYTIKTGASVEHRLSAYSTTGFTVTTNVAVGANTDVMAWVVR